MCGLAGIINSSEINFSLKETVIKMAAAISYRGPDDRGVFYSNKLGLALSHQRLSILDLSINGQQPMISSNEQYVISFNGEIYNHSDLKNLLNKNYKVNWRGTSDTEVLLNLIEKYGLIPALNKCQGMFAFALLDRTNEKIHLVRDRYGEKPLYWGFSGSGINKSLVFASDLNAITCFPYFNNKINESSLMTFFDRAYIPTPYSIYSDIYKLPAGSFVTIDLPIDTNFPLPQPSEWWSLNKTIINARKEQIKDSDVALSSLENLIKNILSNQKNADVPLGVFLSGGVDSTIIATLMQEISSKSINTFTVGFENKNYCETEDAAQIAKYLGTNHSSVVLNDQDIYNIIPNLSDIYSEPFADSSQIPTFLVSREATKSGLKVALSGDGGDENFGGYNRYIWGSKVYNTLKYSPSFLMKFTGNLIEKTNKNSIDSIGKFLSIKHLYQKLNKIIDLKRNYSSKEDFYLSLIGEWDKIKDLVNKDKVNSEIYDIKFNEERFHCCQNLDFTSRMMVYDLLSYLTDDILVKIDRAAMYNSLETRAPLLDHRITQFAWKLPLSMKIRNGRGKWILRQILYKYLPTNMVDRPKSGFAVPLSDWIKGPLKNLSKDLIYSDSLSDDYFFQKKYIKKLFDEHLNNNYDHSAKIWPYIVWKLWSSNRKINYGC